MVTDEDALRRSPLADELIMNIRTYAISDPQPVQQLSEPEGGGIYVVTAEPTGRVIYIGMSGRFRLRRYRSHHKRMAWERSCIDGEVPSIRFATTLPALSASQVKDVEARLIRYAKPACNEHHVGTRLAVDRTRFGNETIGVSHDAH